MSTGAVPAPRMATSTSRTVRLVASAELLGQVGADERQVELVDEAIAHAGRHHARLEVAQPQAFALAIRDLAAQGAIGAEAVTRSRWKLSRRLVTEPKGRSGRIAGTVAYFNVEGPCCLAGPAAALRGTAQALNAIA